MKNTLLSHYDIVSYLWGTLLNSYQILISEIWHVFYEYLSLYRKLIRLYIYNSTTLYCLFQLMGFICYKHMYSLRTIPYLWWMGHFSLPTNQFYWCCKKPVPPIRDWLFSYWLRTQWHQCTQAWCHIEHIVLLEITLLSAEHFGRTKNMYLHMLSFINSEMAKVVETFIYRRQGTVYLNMAADDLAMQGTWAALIQHQDVVLPV